ncbi:MAG: NAD(P)H-dependent glycerol-3-phosphate dehydrogenase [Armatimonadota bacterium]|nr:NAD(P)H-dependent glycerol-3-phosphate dehydrogenase [Armatimonadota bacterium]
MTEPSTDHCSPFTVNSVTVLGAGSWGTALALLLGRKGFPVRLWSCEPPVVDEIQSARRNTAYLPDHLLPHNIAVTGDLAEALDGADCVVFAIPSEALRGVARQVAEIGIQGAPLIVNAGKGLESDTGLRLSQILTEELGEGLASNLVALSGPNLAVEIAKEVPAATVVASLSPEAALAAQRLLTTPHFRVYRNPDLIGVELSGALKNVVAIGAGIGDGFGYGDNTKAALITRGLPEMTRLGVALGADARTFMGLAGVGDLMATCGSPLSRNLRFGRALGRGLSVAEAEAEVRQVVEGKPTCLAAYNLSRRLSVSMPITEQIYLVVFKSKPAKDAVTDLMQRDPKDEYQ